MRDTITISTPAAETDLVELSRVKSELSITVSTYDALLTAKIAEASSDIVAHLGRDLARAGYTKTFWGTSDEEFLLLGRWPLASIASVTVDDVTVSPSEYRLDAETGQLYRLDANGYPWLWCWQKSAVIVFTAGYIMPGESGRNLPEVLESAAIDLVTSYWMAKGRDPTVRSEDIPGLGAVTYWVGAVGEAGELPPGVVAKIAPFRAPFS